MYFGEFCNASSLFCFAFVTDRSHLELRNVRDVTGMAEVKCRLMPQPQRSTAAAQRAYILTGVLFCDLAITIVK